MYEGSVEGLDHPIGHSWSKLEFLHTFVRYRGSWSGRRHDRRRVEHIYGTCQIIVSSWLKNSNDGPGRFMRAPVPPAVISE